MIEGVAGRRQLQHERGASGRLALLFGEARELGGRLAETQQQEIHGGRVRPAPGPQLGRVDADVAEDPSPVGVVDHPASELEREAALRGLGEPELDEGSRAERRVQ